MDLPPHKCSLTIQHNECRDMYKTVVEWVEDEHVSYFDWQNEECKQRAIDTNEMWTMQWYPNTPIGFVAVAAPTLEELLSFAKVRGNT
jgi:hypothetical protein